MYLCTYILFVLLCNNNDIPNKIVDASFVKGKKKEERKIRKRKKPYRKSFMSINDDTC